MKPLRRLFTSHKSPVPRPFDAPLAPKEGFYVVGDLHGCDALLTRLLTKIMPQTSKPTPHIIFVGDYIDRGEESAQVLRRLFNLSQNPEVEMTCLAGNHEDMMLQFLDNPVERGPRWLRFGGLQTLASFGIRGISTGTTGIELKEASGALSQAMGEELVTWLRELPLYWQSGNVAVVHAGADPSLPINVQKPGTLKWGHEAFHHQNRKDGVWVVHGHTIVEKANAANGRVAVDTGAYATNRLTAAYIGSEGVQFIQSCNGPDRVNDMLR